MTRAEAWGYMQSPLRGENRRIRILPQPANPASITPATKRNYLISRRLGCHFRPTHNLHPVYPYLSASRICVHHFPWILLDEPRIVSLVRRTSQSVASFAPLRNLYLTALQIDIRQISRKGAKLAKNGRVNRQLIVVA
jgi:hypothetical protein